MSLRPIRAPIVPRLVWYPVLKTRAPFLANEVGEVLLQLVVQVQVSVEEPASGAAAAVLVERLLWRPR